MGVQDDINGELRAFLDYVAGKDSEDSFVQRLEAAVREAKKNREWRHEYMTLFMRDQENIEKGMEKGLKKGKAEGIIELGLDLGLSEKEILERLQVKLGISLQEAQEYLLDYKNEICMNP